MMTDKLLKSRIDDELGWEPSIDSAEIGVTVDDGIVHLTGHVPTLPQKLAAEAAVQRLRGVRGFVNDLQVRAFGSEVSDEAIAEHAANVLGWLVDFPVGAIKVKVSNGDLTLLGEVPWTYQRQAAQEAVHSVKGVRSINNMIKVAPETVGGDIRDSIEDALDRQASLQSNRINVTVRDGVVNLDGSVAKCADLALAERISWSTQGVKAVEDHLRVNA
jgi:osmotically-inducible protein OsmY